MTKRLPIICGAVLAVVILLYFLLLHPRILAANTMLPGELYITEHEDGSMTLLWPEGENVGTYLVELVDAGGPEEAVLWSVSVEDTSCELPELNTDSELLIRVSSSTGFTTIFGDGVIEGKENLSAYCSGDRPGFNGLISDIDPDADSLSLAWKGADGCAYTIYDDNGKKLKSSQNAEFSVYFGENGDAPYIPKGESRTFYLGLTRSAPGITLQSEIRVPVTVDGEDLLGTVLKLDLREKDDNRYTLSWNQTRGEHYELQELRGGNWETFASFTDEDELSCSIGPLTSYSDHSIRVVAIGGHTLPDSEFAALPDEVSFSTGATVLYATVWPLKDLDIYADTDRTAVTGKASAAGSYSVIGEAPGLFQIRTADGSGYIDSTYCLINLPDYLGELCDYDIKNSYDAIYMVHDYGIPGITGTVITGYEEVASAFDDITVSRTVREDTGTAYKTVSSAGKRPSDFLVPLLYPTAQKLERAALSAKEQGYKIKIYDAFRPWIATRFLYDQTALYLYDEIPEAIYAQMAGDAWEDHLQYLKTRDDVSSGSEENESADVETEFSETEENGGDKSEQRSSRMSYYTLMTNGSYSLSAFLARSGSYHNLGVAIDMTLESLETGEELVMQTAMHDLSWYSVLYRNNSNAELLAEIMTGCGFAPLSSEWWHFQDDELRSNVTGLVSRHAGVTRSGWRASDEGWRYMEKNGQFLRGGTYVVDGTSYVFDDDGYAAFSE